MIKRNSVLLNEIDKARLKLSIEHYINYFIGKRVCEITKEDAAGENRTWCSDCWESYDDIMGR